MDVDLAVVGSGVAGLAAAAAATAEGMSVVVVDERRTVGGSVCGALGASARDPDSAWLMPPLGIDSQERARVERLSKEASDVAFLMDSLVWGIFPSWTLAMTRGGRRTERLDTQQVILATGSYIVRPSFAGFHLDGVVTPLGLARALQTQLVSTTDRIAVLGDNDVADTVIATLANEGIDSITLLGAQSRHVHCPTHELVAPPRAHGTTRVTSLELETADGQFVALEVDWVVVTEPRTVAGELANLAGCDHRFEGYTRGFRPVCAPDGTTSIAGVFVAGSLAGASCGDEAERSGRVAGVAAAVRAAKTSPERLEELLRSEPKRGQVVPQKLPLYHRSHDPSSTSIICRCTGAKYVDVCAAVSNGARSLDDVKRQTRAGMGPCQGRDCQRSVVHALASVGNVDPGTLRPIRGRAPIRPVTADAMFEGEMET